MKKLKILLLFVLFITSTLKSQNYFVENVNISFWKIEFLNPNIGYGVTSSAPNSSSSDIKLYKTTDKGISWIEKYAYTSTSGSVDLSVVSENIVFITNANKILKSVNGGSSFTDVQTFTGGVSLRIDFFDETNGIVFINTNSTNTSLYQLQKTTNAGQNWSGKYNYNVDHSHLDIKDLKFGNSVNEFSGVGSRRDVAHSTKSGMVFLKSTNGGQNVIANITVPDNFVNEELYYLSYINNDIIMYGQKITSNSESRIFYNGFSNYQNVNYMGGNGFYLSGFKFNNNGVGYLARDSKLWKSTNSGVNWNVEIDNLATTGSYNRRNIDFFNESVIYCHRDGIQYVKKLSTDVGYFVNGIRTSGSFYFDDVLTSIPTSGNTFLRGGYSYLWGIPFINENQSNEQIFYKWHDGRMNNEFANYYFDTHNSTIGLNYKTRELSNVSNAISYASETKSLKDENGVINRIHESIGGIFYSRSTNGGTTFTGEEVVNRDLVGHTGNGNKNSMLTNVTSILEPNPVDPEKNVAVVWQRRENNKEVLKFAYRTTIQGSGIYFWNTHSDYNIEVDAPENFNACAHLFARLTSSTDPNYFTLIPHLKPNGSQTQLIVSGKSNPSATVSQYVIDEGSISDLAVTKREDGPYMELHFAYKKNNHMMYQKTRYYIWGSGVSQDILEGETNISWGDGVFNRYNPDISLRNGKPVIGYRGFKNTIHIIQQEDGSGGGFSQEQLALDRYPIIVRYQDPSGNWVNATHYNSLPYSTQENPNVEGSKNGNAHIVNFSANGNSFRQFVKIDGVSGYSPSPNTFNGTDAKLVRGSYSGTTTSGSLLTLSPENSLYRVGRQNFTITNTPIINVFDNVAGVITLEDLDYLFTLGPVLVKNTIIGHDREKVIESHITNPVEFNSSMISNTFSMSDGDTLILGAYGSFIPTTSEYNLNPLRYSVNLVNNTTSEIHRELFSDTITASDSIEVDFFRGFIINDIENTTDSFYVQLVVNPEDLSEGDYYLNGVYQGESEGGGLGDGFAGITNFTRKIFFEGVGNSVPGLTNIPDQFALTQNYPNPFNPVTNISFSIPVESLVKLKVFDITGREVAVLVNELKTPGNYNVSFNGSTLSSGVYFYRIEAGSFVETKRMLLIK